MKKKLLFTFLLSISILFINGCANSGDNTKKEGILEEKPEEKPDEKETIIYDKFTALGKEYSLGKDINALEVGTEIYNRQEKPYQAGEYKEIDFANDLITMYLAGDESIYNTLIDSSSKDRLSESLAFLKTQMSLDESEPIYFHIDNVVYEGKILNEKDTAILNIKGRISKNNNYFVSLLNFTVKVKVQDGKILGDLE